jgi:hypothetical protein
MTVIIADFPFQHHNLQKMKTQQLNRNDLLCCGDNVTALDSYHVIG